MKCAKVSPHKKDKRKQIFVFSSKSEIKREHIRNVSSDCKTHSGKVDAAARWLSEQPDTLRHPIATIRERFGLNALAACRAAALANTLRIERRAEQ